MSTERGQIQNPYKIILLGDSAVGKSKLIERFLLQEYETQGISTYAVTVYKHKQKHPYHNEEIAIEFWDTAGQERFNTMHAAYYSSCDCCILCFDMTRKETYKNLTKWYNELREHRGDNVPVIIVANKVDADSTRATKSFGFAEQRNIQLFLCSASDGSNVVEAFSEAIKKAVDFRREGNDTFVEEVLQFLKEESSSTTGLFKKSS